MGATNDASNTTEPVDANLAAVSLRPFLFVLRADGTFVTMFNLLFL